MHCRNRQLVVTLLITLIAAAVGGCRSGNWPLQNDFVSHPIGNSGGEFQQYGGNPYFHAGVDIVADKPAPDGPFVLTNQNGTVVLSLPGAGSLYNGLILSVGGANDTEQKYWHLDFNSIQQPVRDADANGTVLPAQTPVSRLVEWSSCSYHHLHFETCDNAGCVEPILNLTPRQDMDGPVVVDVQFTDDGSMTVFPPGFPDTVIRGRVDIIARAFDRQFVTATQNHRTGVLKIRYVVSALSTGAVVKTGSTIDFSTIPADGNASILFRNAAPFDSTSAYCATEEYYYVVTNVDDANPSNFAEAFAWNTRAYPNGRYRVEVTVWDVSGNTFSLSKQVRIDNLPPEGV